MNISLQNRIGWIALGLAVLFPLLLWGNIYGWASRFANLQLSLLSLGQAAGITGMTLFALSLILSGRYSWLERWFGGMNNVYLIHHMLGGIAFILLMLHPLLLASANYTLSPQAAAALLLPDPADLPKTLGNLALMSLMVLLVLTFFIKLPYQIWRLSHKLLGLVFFIGGLHAFLIPSDISLNLPLKTYMLGLSFLGLASYVYRTALGRWLVRRYQYRVANIKLLSGSVTELYLEPVNKPMHFRAGQFMFVSIDDQATGKKPIHSRLAQLQTNLSCD